MTLWTTRQRIIDYIAPETALFACDYALLFGSRHAQDVLARQAVEFFRHGYFKTLIVAGGCTQGKIRPEAEEIAEKLVAYGLPAARIITECRSRHTAENVAFVRRMIPQPITEILLVGKLYAKRRYAMTVKAQWPEIERISCFGLNYFGVPRSDWWRHAELRRRVIEELRKIPRYVAAGDIREVAVENGCIL